MHVTKLASLLTGVLGLLCLPTTTRAQGPDQRVAHFVSWAQNSGRVASFQMVRAAPTHWKRGLIVGAIVGTALAAVSLTQCDSDANSDCPGWGRAAGLVAVGSATGALVGALIHRSD